MADAGLAIDAAAAATDGHLRDRAPELPGCLCHAAGRTHGSVPFPVVMVVVALLRRRARDRR